MCVRSLTLPHARSVFDGALKPRTIAKFLDKHAPPLKKSSASGGKKADKAKAKPAEGAV
jgi:hypothetical protein